MALILGNLICASRPFRIVSGVTLNANIKIEGIGLFCVLKHKTSCVLEFYNA